VLGKTLLSHAAVAATHCSPVRAKCVDLGRRCKDVWSAFHSAFALRSPTIHRLHIKPVHPSLSLFILFYPSRRLSHPLLRGDASRKLETRWRPYDSEPSPLAMAPPLLLFPSPWAPSPRPRPGSANFRIGSWQSLEPAPSMEAFQRTNLRRASLGGRDLGPPSIRLIL